MFFNPSEDHRVSWWGSQNPDGLYPSPCCLKIPPSVAYVLWNGGRSFNSFLSLSATANPLRREQSGLIPRVGVVHPLVAASLTTKPSLPKSDTHKPGWRSEVCLWAALERQQVGKCMGPGRPLWGPVIRGRLLWRGASVSLSLLSVLVVQS